MPSTAPWWRSAVIYQVYIRSFADGDGDGVGDIAGIRSRLPYLKSLGVDALWINPWYKSPMADHGYDVADFREIDPLFGSLAEAEQLIEEAHRHGIRVIPDIVPNHTSDQHAWFRAALAAGPGSPERERYVFRPGRGPGGGEPPNDWVSCFGGPAWTRLPDGQWYLHLFAPQQPDLNWEHPEVRAEFESILRFWFGRGVDGFRIDVAHGLVKDPELPDLPPREEPAGVLGPLSRRDEADAANRIRRHLDHPHWDRDEVHDIYRAWRKVADEFPGDRSFVAEAWADTPERLAAYVRRDGLHTAFNFDFLMASWDAKDLRSVIDDSLAMLGAVGAPATWVLSNHDVMRHPSRYGRKTVKRWVANEPYRPEGPPDLELGRRRARAAALLMLALPGGAYIYQGEELGLPEVEDLPEAVLQDPIWERSGHTDRGRDGCRVPLPWSGRSEPYGFSPAGAAAAPWLPQPANWGEFSVQAQTGDETSMLELYRAALRLRRELPALGDGTLTWLEAPDGVLAFRRAPGFACVVNLSAEAHPLPGHTSLLLSSGPVEGGVLAPDHAAWLAL
ncbi:glycoside hydrolase family 13 protein [Streptomyces sp. NL15-2K]|uniref:glycoside hydrolase family 13 protein n=1 Tax=Streptomyces sp. NL15-2K TaxID=376149 RepID=UPI000F57332C|nr:MULTISPECIES: glycoside hydrolase family 13 protein [Actinomycetes]WKX15715.1 glycoside hydrolase family 13 protein [Kutzneria buriramensis]GCB44381.1 alpha-glucosidase [Streptomyces sp. NL15-2K]